MDDRRASLAIRTLRVRRGWRQRDLAARAGISRQLVTRIESGRVERVSIGSLRRVAEAIGASITVMIRTPGGEVDRALNVAHAAMHETIARLFRDHESWVTTPEASYSIYGERGVIDVLAWHELTRTILVVELKTLVVDINDLMASMDRRRRLAGRISRDRGWSPLRVGVWVAVADTPTNHRRLADHATVLRTAFPADGRTVRRWLRQPVGELRALSFMSSATRGGRNRGFGTMRRVRGRRTGNPRTLESDAPSPGGQMRG